MINLILGIASLICLAFIRFYSKEKYKILWNIACIVNLAAIGYLTYASYLQGQSIETYKQEVDFLKLNTVEKEIYDDEMDSMKTLLILRDQKIKEIESKYDPKAQLVKHKENIINEIKTNIHNLERHLDFFNNNTFPENHFKELRKIYPKTKNIRFGDTNPNPQGLILVSLLYSSPKNFFQDSELANQFEKTVGRDLNRLRPDRVNAITNEFLNYIIGRNNYRETMGRYFKAFRKVICSLPNKTWKNQLIEKSDIDLVNTELNKENCQI